MARDRRRRGSRQPRVDDLFYDNPPTPGEEEAADATEASDGAETGQDAGTVGTGAEPGHPETAPVGSESASGGGYAARGDRDLPGSSDGTYAGGPSSARPRTGAAVRWARAVVVAGAVAGLVYAAGGVGTLDLATALGTAEPAPTAPTQVAGLAVVTDSSVGCPGPGFFGLDDPSVAEPHQGVGVYAGTAPAEALPEGVEATGTGELRLVGTPEGDSRTTTRRGEVVRISAYDARWARVTADGSLAAGLGASQLGYSFEEQRWGLTTAVCGPARDDHWLVAGGAQPGRAERLVLTNPTGNPVTVSAEVLGAAGPVEVVGGSGIVVPPGGRHVLLLDALAPGEKRPVVHLSTTGGPVVAALADRWLEGTLDRGTEVTTPTAAPGTQLLIPAVPAPRPGTADTATVRVAVPGTEAAVVQLRALTADGPVRLEQGVANVEPGSVVDVEVSDLPEGTQGVEVAADTPVVAAAHAERRDEPEGIGEMAWVPAVTPSSDLIGAPLANRGEADLGRTLSMASLEGARVEVVTVRGERVVTSELEVAAASNRTVPVGPGVESVWVRPVEGSVSTAVITTLEHPRGTQIAGLPLPEAPVTRQLRSIAPWLP
ncbi:DUF5719 family protein [Ornithinimicrobium cavernae]|uniref:DUF5719 family protein n=1 Tax=Ornithinimicrobium cavernae TaxID=2666047 RepID=UPI000D6923E4|nr:DUF5719 family protein [Ornithinimicrobium cavernae]